MSALPGQAATRYPLARGVDALAGGLAWIEATKSLLVADAHFAYENVVGGALPLWSMAEIVAALLVAVRRYGAREIVFLGDIVHGSSMSDGAARDVRSALETLRAECIVTLVAGNHEGRSRAFAVLGETVESCERAGWRLVHGDRPEPFAGRAIVGHFHPSLSLGSGTFVPAFLASERLVVVPALTPYSRGLDALSADCGAALAAWGEKRAEMTVVAVTGEKLFPFGAAGALTRAISDIRRGSFSSRRGRRALRPDP